MGFLQAVAKNLTSVAPEKTALISAGSSPDAVFVVAAGPESRCDVAAIGPEVAALLGGRGGGRAGLFQGKAGSFEQWQEALELLQECSKPD